MMRNINPMIRNGCAIKEKYANIPKNLEIRFSPFFKPPKIPVKPPKIEKAPQTAKKTIDRTCFAVL